MVKIEHHRTTWGIEEGPNFDNWAGWFHELKAHGYSGVQINPHHIPESSFPRVRQILDDANLELSVLLHTSWVDYTGPRPVNLKAESHLQGYRSAIQLYSKLKPVWWNFQSGQDAWDVEESIKFYRGTLEVDKEFGISNIVSHETHRNRSLFNPYAAIPILKAVPELRVTADVSHWVVSLERLLDVGDEDKAILEALIPHVTHIHARIGTTQASQAPEPTHPAFEEERKFFDNLWSRIIKKRVQAGTEKIIFVPEYGPFPYHPINSARTHGEVADSEAKRLQVIFEEAARS